MATFTVTTTADEAFGGGTLATEAADGTGLSLREAMGLANTSSGADTIAFDSSLNGAVLRLTGGELTVIEDVTIDGTTAGASGVIISGDANGNDRDAAGAIGAAGTGITDLDNSAGFLGDNSRILISYFGNPGIEVIGLTLTGGVATGSGGAILNGNGDITVTDSTISGNSASDYGGGIAGFFGAITLTGSTLTGNHAGSDGGGMRTFIGTLTITDSAVTENTSDGSGGGFSGGASAIVTDSTIADNSASLDGGGFQSSGLVTFVGSTLADNTGDSGGGASTSTLRMIDSTVSGNNAAGSGGGLNVRTASIINSTVAGNTASTDGGGIYNRGTLDLVNSTVTGNYAGDNGGGIYNDDAATITNSLVTGNAASGTGNDIFNNFALVSYSGGNIIGGTLYDASGAYVASGITGDLIFDQTVNVNHTGILGGGLADNGGPVETVALRL